MRRLNAVPPARRKPKKDPAAIAKEAHERQGHLSDPAGGSAPRKVVGEMPHTTHASLPILQPRATDDLPEELPSGASMDAEDADVQLPPPPREGHGVQATHVTPPDPDEPVIGNVD